MRRAILALAVATCPAVLIGLVGGGTAGATTNPLTATIDKNATLGPGGTTFTLTGTITCPSGDIANVSTQVNQRSGNVVTFGSAQTSQFTCTGSSQSWQAQGIVPPFVPGFGGSFHKGRASALVGASAFDTNTQTDLTDQFGATLNFR